tara:strand:+ start:375 stop:500 length:126 start_codon:yes stop_codon:yes gene_type:complete
MSFAYQKYSNESITNGISNGKKYILKEKLATPMMATKMILE